MCSGIQKPIIFEKDRALIMWHLEELLDEFDEMTPDSRAALKIAELIDILEYMLDEFTVIKDKKA